jgi:hypothetical protein
MYQARVTHPVHTRIQKHIRTDTYIYYDHTYITYIQRQTSRHTKLRTCWSQNSNFSSTEENSIKRNIPKKETSASNTSKSILNRILNSSK